MGESHGGGDMMLAAASEPTGIGWSRKGPHSGATLAVDLGRFAEDALSLRRLLVESS